MGLFRSSTKQQPDPPRRVIGPSPHNQVTPTSSGGDAVALYERAMQAAHQGHHQTAKELFGRSVLAGDAAPLNLSTAIAVASSFFQLGRLAVHEQAFGEASHRFGKSAETFRLATREANRAGRGELGERLAAKAAEAAASAEKAARRSATSSAQAAKGAKELRRAEAALQARQREIFATALGRV